MPIAHDVEFDRVGLVGKDLRPYSLAITVPRIGRTGRVTKGDVRTGNVIAREVASFEQQPASDNMRMWGDGHFVFLVTAAACVASEAPVTLCECRRADACN